MEKIVIDIYNMLGNYSKLVDLKDLEDGSEHINKYIKFKYKRLEEIIKSIDNNEHMSVDQKNIFKNISEIINKQDIELEAWKDLYLSTREITSSK